MIALCTALAAGVAIAHINWGAVPPAPAVPPSPPASNAPAPPIQGPLQVLPRESFSWKADSLGQVLGETIACAPIQGRIKSIAPVAPLPEPLAAKLSASSLRISGTAPNGLTRDIAVLHWVGPVITWKRMPVPVATFEPSLKALAAWMMTQLFEVTLEDGSAVRVGTESQRLALTLGTASSNSVTSQLADVPKGMTLAVPGATPMPAGGTMGAGPFLVEMARSTMAIRIATYPDTILDIEVTDMPAQLRVSAMTPSGMRLERVLEEISVTDELLKGAPDDQRRVLSAQRAVQQSAADELRKKAGAERIRPTGEPIKACIMDPVTGREFVTIAIEVKDGTADGADGAVGGDAAGSVAPGRGRGAGARPMQPSRKAPSGGWGAP